MNDFFQREFLLSLPSDTDEALVALCKEFSRLNSKTSKKHAEYIESIAIAKSFCQSRKIASVPSFPEITPNAPTNVARITDWFGTVDKIFSNNLQQRRAIELYSVKENEYDILFGNIEYYEFSDSEFARIQSLINELRELIGESHLVSETHKIRLLRKLEAMQSELHQKTSDIDRFWSFIGEAGITIRKFGDDMKPISERMNELGKIVISVIMATEGIQALPEIAALLIDK